MKRILSGVPALLLLLSLAAVAQEPFTLEKIMSSPFPTDLAAARQGSRIAWVFYQEGKRNIWVAEGPNFAARQLTRYDADDGQEISSLSFSSPYGEFVVFVLGGNKNSAGDVPNPMSNPEGAEQSI